MILAIGATTTIWRKHMRKFLGNGEELFGTMIQPVLWVALFGIGMARTMSGDPTPGGGSYIGFMLPGIVALGAMGGAIGGGMNWLDERVRGILKEYLVAPIPRISILLGNVGSTVSKAMVQAAVIFVVGALLGAEAGGSVGSWVIAVALAIGYSIGFAGLALSVASRTDDLMAYHAMIMLLNLPVLFLSNALYSLESLPGWMRIGAMANPTSYLVDGIRQTIVRGQIAEYPLWLCVVVVSGFGLLGLLLATRSISSMTGRK